MFNLDLILYSKVIIEFFRFLLRKFINHFNVELVLWVLAAPVLLKNSICKFLNSNNFVVCFFVVEFGTSPNENFMIVKLVSWNTVLSSYTKDKESVFLEIFKIKNSYAFVPVWIREKFWFQLLLFDYFVPVLLSLKHCGLHLDEVLDLTQL